MASAFNKFQPFIAAVHNKIHDLSSDQLKIALTNTVPTSSMATLSDITEIAYTNLSSRNVTTTSSAQSSGLYKLICQGLLLTASGDVATFRYVVLYNDTSASDNLIAWWDYGSAVTLANTETFNIAFDGSNGVFTNT
jgi:hypothetical protein